VQHLLSTLSDAEIGTVEAAEQGGTSGTPSGPAGSAAEEQRCAAPRSSSPDT
jgi:hypothetical protein